MAASSRRVVRTGQLVLSRIDARNGAIGIVPAELDGAVVSNDFPSFAPNCDRVLPEYMGWLVRSNWFVDQCRSVSEGTTNRVRLNEARFLALRIPLPPLSEQRRMVAWLDAVAVRVGEVKRLRAEVEGEQRLHLAESRRSAFTRCTQTVVLLGDVCIEIIDNLHSNPRLTTTDDGIPCVRSPDVGDGTLDLSHCQMTDDEEYAHRTMRGRPQPGDIVFVREGGRTGRCAAVSHGQAFSLGQRVMLLRPDAARIVPAFLVHQLLSPLVQDAQIAPLCKGSAAPHLNIAALRCFAVIVPPLAEQLQVVRWLDAQHAVAEEANRSFTSTRGTIGNLLREAARAGLGLAAASTLD